MVMTDLCLLSKYTSNLASNHHFVLLFKIYKDIVMREWPAETYTCTVAIQLTVPLMLDIFEKLRLTFYFLKMSKMLKHCYGKISMGKETNKLLWRLVVGKL